MSASKLPSDAGSQIDELAAALYRLAGEESIRVIEAIAAALANRRTEEDRSGRPSAFVLDEAGAPGLAEAASPWVPAESPKWQACRRIARRAMRGSLSDPTCGATAFHHIEASPAWCREHLPVAVHGPYLFYRV